MERIITIDNIVKYKPLSANTNVRTKVDFCIDEAQEFDLKPILGEQLYLDFIEKMPNGWADKTAYKTLFEGGTYTYSGKSYSFGGIERVLVYYAYARIVPNLEENVTATGVVIKTNEFSQPSGEKVIQRKVGQAISGAEVFKKQLEEYLYRNQSTFPLWVGNAVEPRTGSFRISAVGGNKKRVASSHACRNCGRYSNCNCYR